MQIAAALALDERTVDKWIQCPTYQPRGQAQRASKLDPHKGAIVRLLATHPFTAQQLLQRLREQGYTGGYSILKEYVRTVRPPHQPAFLKLHFAPGQCAQVDWGSAGFLPVGNTRRRLSFFVRVLCYSRRMYVEFTLAQTQEHFLACHQHAFEYFNAVPAEVMVDYVPRHIIDHDARQHAPKVFKGVLVTGQEVFEAFGQGKLHEHLAAVSQHHDEEVQAAAGVAHRDKARLRPVHLGALPRGKLQG